MDMDVHVDAGMDAGIDVNAGMAYLRALSVYRLDRQSDVERDVFGELLGGGARRYEDNHGALREEGHGDGRVMDMGMEMDMDKEPLLQQHESLPARESATAAAVATATCGRRWVGPRRIVSRPHSHRPRCRWRCAQAP